jgi:phage shock protein A
VSETQGHEGNVAWLKRKLREVQDTIVQLRETQRLMEERHMKYSRECETTEKEARVALTSAHRKNESSWCPSLHPQRIRQILAVLNDTFL